MVSTLGKLRTLITVIQTKLTKDGSHTGIERAELQDLGDQESSLLRTICDFGLKEYASFGEEKQGDQRAEEERRLLTMAQSPEHPQ